MYPTEDMTCANCAHRSTHALTINGREVYVCAVEAANPDIRGTVALVSLDSHCAEYGEEWEPSDVSSTESEDAALYHTNPAAYYGVRLGIDFPATLAL